MSIIKLNEDRLNKAYKRLIEDSYFNDEQLFGSTIIENYFGTLTSALKGMGYPNEINKCGGFYEGVGAIYSVYDASELSYEQAKLREARHANVR